MLLGGMAVHSAHQKVDAPRVQFPGQRSQVPDDDMKGHPWILSRELMDDGRIDCRYRMLAPSHPYLPGRRIGKGRDVLNALSQLVEHFDSALDERAAIWCRFYALATPVE